MSMITLSFDNGPHEDATPLVLDVLARHELRATFFVIGRNVETPAGHALVRRAHAAGHRIGNHTYSHTMPLGHLPDPQVQIEEIERAADLIAEYAGPHRLFRPYGQGGVLDERVLGTASLRYLIERHYTCIAWNAVPRDWQDPVGWVATALEQVAALPEAVLVLHDIGSGAMKHLDAFIVAARAQGHAFRQEFASSCTLIADGVPRGDVARFVTAG